MQRLRQHGIQVIRIVFLSIGFLGSCSLIPQPNMEMFQASSDFIGAVTEQRPSDARAMLSRATRQLIPERAFTDTPGDFRGIINALRDAQVTMRTRDEDRIFVPLDGDQKGVVLVFVEEEGAWKIANIIEDSSQKQ